jgi:hypothetical protein
MSRAPAFVGHGAPSRPHHRPSGNSGLRPSTRTCVLRSRPPASRPWHDPDRPSRGGRAENTPWDRPRRLPIHVADRSPRCRRRDPHRLFGSHQSSGRCLLQRRACLGGSGQRRTGNSRALPRGLLRRLCLGPRREQYRSGLSAEGVNRRPRKGCGEPKAGMPPVHGTSPQPVRYLRPGVSTAAVGPSEYLSTRHLAAPRASDRFSGPRSV